MAADLIRRMGAAAVLLGVLAGCGTDVARTPEPVAVATSLLPEDRLELPEFDFVTYKALLGELAARR